MTFDRVGKAGELRAMADIFDPAPTPVPPTPTPTPDPTPSPNLDYLGLTLGDPNVWNQVAVFKENFPTLAASGLFAQTYKYWSVYPKGWLDTSKKGVYDPARISVVDVGGNRVLRQMVTANSDGSFGGCVLQPEFGPNGIGYIGSVRYSERRKLSQQDNGHDVLLGWPANDRDWPTKSGEPDHVEYDTLNNPTIGGWLHVVGATSGQDHQVELKSDVKAYDDFHVVTVEQIANDSYRRYIDGHLWNVVLDPGKSFTTADNAAPNRTILPSGFHIPGTVPLRFCKQLESNGNKPTRGGAIVDTDWVVIQGLK